MKNILASLLAIISNLSNLVRNTQANYGKHANLEDLMATIRPYLEKHKLVVVQEVKKNDAGDLTLYTHLYDADAEGDKMCFEYPITPAQPGFLGMGAAVTYARRYAYKNIFFLAEEDNDNNGVVDKSNNGCEQTRYEPPRNEPPSELPPIDEAPHPAGDDFPDFKPPTQDNGLGSYVCQFGKKHKGFTLDQIGGQHASNYAQWLKESAHKNKKPLDGPAKEFVEKVEIHFG